MTMKLPPDDLRTTLRDWRVTPPPDPGFRQAVWTRIARQTSETWPAYLRAHAVAWALALVLTFSAAAYAATAMARSRARIDRDAMVTTYLVELDPRVQAVLNRVQP